MTRAGPTLRAVLVAAVFLTACDCEERLRRTISNPGKRAAAEEDAGARPSGPAEKEPNEKAENATPIVIGNELRPVEGEIRLPEDVDWFAFSVSGEPGSFQISVEPDTALDVSLHVDVPDGAPLSYDVGRRGDAERIPVFRIGTKPQKVAIRSESNSTGSYTIRLERHLGSGLEAEPNDETNVATTFAVPGEIQGYYDRPDDRDVYRLEGAPDTAYVLEIAPLDGVRQIARIFEDATLKVPRLTAQISDEPVQIPNLALSGDTVRWLVLTPLADGNPERPYRLRVSVHPQMEETLEVEPNDEDGMIVEKLPATYVGYLHTADDRDRFEIESPEKNEDEPSPLQPSEQQTEGETVGADRDPLKPYRAKAPHRSVSAVLKWKDDASDLGLRWLTDAEPKEFRRSGKRRVVRACGLDLDGSGVLEVRAASLGTIARVGEPTYSVTLEANDSESGWESEPNDDRAQADVLDAGEPRAGALATSGDVDRWVFAVDANEELAAESVSLSVGGEGVDLVMRIRDDSGGVVANVDNSAVGGTEKLRLDLPAGLYWVDIEWKNGEFCAPYRLELNR